MSFEEYSALRRRGRAKHSGSDRVRLMPEAESETSPPPAASRKPFLSGLGDLVESVEVQMVVLLLSFIDISLCVLQLTAEAGHLGEDKTVAARTAEFVQYQVAFTLSIYVLELVCLGAVFRLRLIGHAGYLSDLISLGLVVTNQVTARNPAIRLASAMRLWRVGRVVNTMLAAADAEHGRTQQQVGALKEELSLAQMNSKRMEAAVARQQKRSEQLENSIQSQHEELDTLREALSIAAQTVARSGGYDLSDSDGEQQANERVEDGEGAIGGDDVMVDHQTLLPIMSSYRKDRAEKQRQRGTKQQRQLQDNNSINSDLAAGEETKFEGIDSQESSIGGEGGSASDNDGQADNEEDKEDVDDDDDDDDDDGADMVFSDAKPFAKQAAVGGEGIIAIAGDEMSAVRQSGLEEAVSSTAA
jgi:hypothetical protein